MDDLISRQMELDALRTWDQSKMYLPIEFMEFVNGLPSALETTMKLSSDAVEVVRWIPCSEGLPEKNGRYLVTRGLKACNSIWNRVYIINYSDLMGLKAEKIWWDGNVGKSDFQRIDDVVAWRELPDPWSGEDNG